MTDCTTLIEANIATANALNLKVAGMAASDPNRTILQKQANDMALAIQKTLTEDVSKALSDVKELQDGLKAAEKYTTEAVGKIQNVKDMIGAAASLLDFTTDLLSGNISGAIDSGESLIEAAGKYL